MEYIDFGDKRKTIGDWVDFTGLKNWYLDVLGLRNIKEQNIRQERVVASTAIAIVGTVAIVLFGISAYLKGNHLLAALDFSTSTIFLVLLFILYRNGLFQLAKVFGITTFGLFLLYLVGSGGTGNASIVLVLIYPLVSCFLLGAVRGAVAALALLCCSVFIFLLSGHYQFLAEYSFELRVRISAAYFIIGLFSFILEWDNEHYREELDRERAELDEKVQERTAELKEINLKLVAEIDDNLRSQKKLARNERLLAETQRIGKVGGWEIDLDAGANRWTSEIYNICEVDEKKVVQSIDLCAYCTSESKAVLQVAMEKALASGESFDIELDIVTAQGNQKSIHAIGAVDTEHRVLHGFFQDVTEAKRLRKQHDMLQAQLNQKQKMESIGRLAGGIAHDFNNMLGVIIGRAEIISRDHKIEANTKIESSLKEIIDAAERSSSLTRQLLAYAARQPAVQKVVDPNAAIGALTGILRSVVGEHINFAWKPSEEAWPIKIDTTQLDQILVNLCVNSRDAITGTGKITISTGTENVAAEFWSGENVVTPGEYTVVTVSDDGRGIDAEALPHIFEPFFTTKQFGVSAGLGLSTVYGTVRQNDGYIVVESAPDQGTTIKILFPRHVGETPLPKGAVVPAVTAGGCETILLVEDEPSVLNMATQMLKMLNYRVIAAGNPNQALELAMEHSNEITLMLTDLVMPEMNGSELAKKVAAHIKGVKVLYMSGYTADIITNHGILDADLPFLPKPFTTKALSAKLRELLDN